ncbi:diguanylate cyclase [Agrobacterium tumefaciens]|uniref:diguanylate cyclase n=1 Tax=Agrobacterium tumefaciens TaxID=358 RepID=UPI00157314C1|nr:diguanylate cyclase [Agrobacterium tumefaciens]WCK69511.1 diguanylate cyclase [Agrobacterium tumefaciens]
MATRFGGEGFTVVMRDVAEPDAICYAKDLLSAIKALGISHTGRRDGLTVVTVSAWVASSITSRRRSGDDLIAAADAAIHKAKDVGRNQLSIAASSMQQRQATSSRGFFFRGTSMSPKDA